MANAWFRFYSEALNDPKVQRLDGETFKDWVNLLCLACNGNGTLPPIADIEFALRKDNIACVSLLDRLRIAGLIDVVKGGANGSTIAMHGWDKRQYKSDTSKERVKRYRAVTRNVSVTPPDTDTDTDTDTDKQILSKASICTDVVENPVKPDTNPKPRKRAFRLEEDFIPPDSWLEFAQTKTLTETEAGQEWGKFRDYHLSRGSLMVDWNAAWRTWVRNALEFKQRQQQREARVGK